MPAGSSGGVSVEAAIDELAASIRHRDARRCRDIVDAIDPGALDHQQTNSVEMLHARCEMIGGDCAGGARRAETLYRRVTVASAVATAVQFESDSFCPLTGDLATIKRRLLAQTTHMMLDPVACRTFVGPARQVATAAATDIDKRVAGSALVAIAKCFSSAKQCTDAHALLREADALVPGLDNPGELTSACQ